MNLGKRTIEGCREALFHKLQVKSRTGLALYALKLGIMPMRSISMSRLFPQSKKRRCYSLGAAAPLS